MTGQLPLLEVLADERTLDDAARTVLEAIDRRGSLTAKQAGRVVYRLRGFRVTIGVPTLWVIAAGARVLGRLERHGLVERRKGRWSRCSDLIGPERSEAARLVARDARRAPTGRAVDATERVLEAAVQVRLRELDQLGDLSDGDSRRVLARLFAAVDGLIGQLVYDRAREPALIAPLDADSARSEGLRESL